LGAFFCALPLPFLLLSVTTLGLCVYELGGLLKFDFDFPTFVWAVLIWYLLAQGPPFPVPHAFASAGIAVGGLVLGCAGAWQKAKQQSMFAGLFAPLWVITPLGCLVMLHSDVPKGTTWFLANSALLAILPLWAGDTAAIFAGKAFGKHLLAPAISPKKTIEGAVANLLACTAIAVPLGMWIGYTWWVASLCGVLAGTLGQIGDLFESSIKRQVGAKDSGTVLPGHGGMLDRVDSLLFTAPAVYALLSFFKLH
jgi:CDP-diglyceride synthetase